MVEETSSLGPLKQLGGIDETLILISDRPVFASKNPMVSLGHWTSDLQALLCSVNWKNIVSTSEDGCDD